VAGADAVTPAVLPEHRDQLPVAETSLSFGLRLRLSLLGLGLGLCGLAICVVLGLLIATAVYHSGSVS
jgi:hypothetical protein